MNNFLFLTKIVFVNSSGSTTYASQEASVQERIQLLEQQMHAAAEALRFLEADRPKEAIKTLRKRTKNN